MFDAESFLNQKEDEIVRKFLRKKRINIISAEFTVRNKGCNA